MQRSRRTYLKTVGAVGSLGVTGLAGCTVLQGDGEGDDTITIGATVPRSGAFESLGSEVEQGYELGVALMNDELDQEVDIVIEDDESDEGEVQSSLEQILSNNDVDLFWGSFSSPLVGAGANFAEQEGVPFLGGFFANETPHRSNDYEWSYIPFPKSRDVARSTRGLLELIPEGERPTNVGIWEPETEWGAEQADYWNETLDDAGFDIVLRETFQLQPGDWSTLVSQSADADVEVLLSNPTPPGGIASINAMQDAGWTPEVLKYVRAPDPADWWGALGQAGAFALMCPGWVPGLTGGGNDAFWSAYEDEYGLDDGELIPVAVGGAYNVAQTSLQAIQATDSTDPGNLQSALRDEEFETVIGTFSFEDNGLPAEGELTAPTGQWWEGGQHTVFPDVDGEQAIDLQYPITPWDER